MSRVVSSLPPSSPPPAHDNVSDNDRTPSPPPRTLLPFNAPLASSYMTPIRARPRASSLPPMSADDVNQSTPAVGTKEQIIAIKRRKSQRGRLLTLAEQKAAAEAEAEEIRVASMKLALAALSNLRVTFGDLAEYVFDPETSNNVQWFDFFSKTGRATRILNWWVSSSNSATARKEVKEWAVSYVCKNMKQDARRVTSTQLLQTQDRLIDSDYLLNFSFSDLYSKLQQVAPVAMRVLRSFATSTRQLRTGLSPARILKKTTVCMCRFTTRRQTHWSYTTRLLHRRRCRASGNTASPTISRSAWSACISMLQALKSSLLPCSRTWA